jgi:oligopeptide transport system ATP-binding protein
MKANKEKKNLKKPTQKHEKRFNESEKLRKILEPKPNPNSDYVSKQPDFVIPLGEEKIFILPEIKCQLNISQERLLKINCFPNGFISITKTSKTSDGKHYNFSLKGISNGRCVVNLKLHNRIISRFIVSAGTGINPNIFKVQIGEALKIKFAEKPLILSKHQEKKLDVSISPAGICAFVKSDDYDEVDGHRYFIIKGLSDGHCFVQLKLGKKPLGLIEVSSGTGINRAEDDIVKLNNVRIAFKHGNDERVIINHMNLNIKRGEILGLVGESGSGKTTVGRAIIRVNHVSGGTISYNNTVISGKVPHSVDRALKVRMQMIFQDPSASLNDRANVDYIVSEGLRAFHLYRDEKDRLEKVENIMKEVGLRPEHLKRYPHEFSGGQRQRIGIARCMIMNPEFIIADEPISALDVSIRAQVLNLIKQFQIKNNMTVIFIAHDLSVVKYISDRIAVIYNGHLVEIASANHLFELPLHPYTKSLLSAVPIPDPRVERVKKIVVYNPHMHNYTEDDMPELYEVEPNHWVHCDKKELQEYLRIVEESKHEK